METAPGDVILVHHNDRPMVYARVERIEADVKDGWWQLTLTLLTIPSSKATWILRESYIDGGDFTMSGEKMRLQRLPKPDAMAEPEITPPPPDEGGGGDDKVVDLFSRKKGPRK